MFARDRTDEVLLGRAAIWLALLAGGLLAGERAEYVAAWTGGAVVAVALAWLPTRRAVARRLESGLRLTDVARLAGPIVDIVATAALVGLTAGLDSSLRVLFLVVAVGHLAVYPARLAVRLGLLNLATFIVLALLDVSRLSAPDQAPGVVLDGLGLAVVVLGGGYLMAELQAGWRERDLGLRQSAALSSAAGAFLLARDVESLAGPIVEAIRRLVDPAWTGLLLRAEGGLALVGSAGLSEAAADSLAAAAEDGPLAAAGERWSDDEPALLAAGLPAGTRAAFCLPIRADGRTDGLVVAGYRERRRFEPALRRAARSLVGEIAVGHQLALARQSLAGELDRLEAAGKARADELQAVVDDLRGANAAKSEYLAGTSYELRSNLAAMVGFSGVVLGGLDGPLTAAQRQDLETVERASRRMLELVEGLLDVAQIESGRAELRREEVSLRDLLHELVEEQRPRAAERGVGLRLGLGRLPARAAVDPRRLRLALRSLIANAIASSPEGIVRVRGDVRPCPDGSAMLTVEITQGVAEAEAEVEGDGAAATAALGLSVARQFVRLHGGEVQVSSVPGAGRKFLITVPLPLIAAAPREPGAARRRELETGAAGATAQLAPIVLPGPVTGEPDDSGDGSGAPAPELVLEPAAEPEAAGPARADGPEADLPA